MHIEGQANLKQDLVDHLRKNLPVLPDRTVEVLVGRYGLSTKDAGTLLSFDNGDRLEYFFEVTNQLARARNIKPSDAEFPALGKAVGNWYVNTSVLHADTDTTIGSLWSWVASTKMKSGLNRAYLPKSLLQSSTNCYRSRSRHGPPKDY